LGKDTKGTGDTEEDGVVVLLNETVVLEEDTGVGIDVRPWVLGLSVLSQDTGLKEEFDFLVWVKGDDTKDKQSTVVLNLKPRHLPQCCTTC